MQIYEENRTQQDTNEIDLLKVANNMWKVFCKYCKRFVVLILLVSVIFTGYRFISYEPSYQAYATYVVSKSQTTAGTGSKEDAVVANRLASTFEYILEKGSMGQTIEKRMGVSSLPVIFSASAIEDTNILTITAVSNVGAQSWQALEILLELFPDASYDVVGKCNFTIIDQSGSVEEPSNPLNKITAFIKGLILGMIVALGIMFLIAYNTSTISDTEDLKKYLNISCLGTVPVVRFKKRNQKIDTTISVLNDKTPLAFRESVNTLRTRVEKEMREKKLVTLLVSSSLPGEGKTTISMNLALSLKDREKKVLLIDGDLRNPSIHEMLGITKTNIRYGISDVLTGKVSPMEAVIYDQNLDISVMPGRKSVGNASELLSSSNMQHMMEELKDYYDYIIVDTPPAAMMTDASVVAAYMDAVLYVIRQDYAKVNYVSEGIGLLSDSDAEVIGCILNCSQPGFGSYGYGKYGYSRYSRYGYGED